MRWIFVHTAFVLGLASCTVRIQDHSELGREFASRLCAAQSECNCAEDMLFPDCEARVERELAENERKALSAGLAYDSACMENVLERLDTLSTCETNYPPSGAPCAVYGGNNDVGEPCEFFEAFPLMYGCRWGLTCVDGACAEVPPILPQGAICSEDQSFSPTGDLGLCEWGLRCDSLDTRTCVPIPPIPKAPLGGECTELAGCEGRNICRAQAGELQPSDERPGVCDERTPPGEPCTLVYECDRICENGYCQIAPPAACELAHQWWQEREYF